MMSFRTRCYLIVFILALLHPDWVYAVSSKKLQLLAETLVQSMPEARQPPSDSDKVVPLMQFRIVQYPVTVELLKGFQRYGILNRLQTGTTMMGTPNSETRFLRLDHLDFSREHPFPLEVAPKYFSLDVDRPEKVTHPPMSLGELHQTNPTHQIYFTFDSSQLISRTTFAIGDTGPGDGQGVHPLTRLQSLKQALQGPQILSPEAHVWGPVSLDHIKEIWITGSMDQAQIAEVKQMAQDRGLNVYYVGNMSALPVEKRLLPELSFSSKKATKASEPSASELLSFYRSAKTDTEKKIIVSHLIDRGVTQGLPPEIREAVNEGVRKSQQSYYTLVSGAFVPPRLRAVGLTCLLDESFEEKWLSPQQVQSVVKRMGEPGVLAQVQEFYPTFESLRSAMDRLSLNPSQNQSFYSDLKLKYAEKTTSHHKSLYSDPDLSLIREAVKKSQSPGEYLALLRHQLLYLHPEERQKLIHETLEHASKMNFSKAQLDEFFYGEPIRSLSDVRPVDLELLKDKSQLHAYLTPFFERRFDFAIKSEDKNKVAMLLSSVNNVNLKVQERQKLFQKNIDPLIKMLDRPRDLIQLIEAAQGQMEPTTYENLIAKASRDFKHPMDWVSFFKKVLKADSSPVGSKIIRAKALEVQDQFLKAHPNYYELRQFASVIDRSEDFYMQLLERALKNCRSQQEFLDLVNYDSFTAIGMYEDPIRYSTYKNFYDQSIDPEWKVSSSEKLELFVANHYQKFISLEEPSAERDRLLELYPLLSASKNPTTLLRGLDTKAKKEVQSSDRNRKEMPVAAPTGPFHSVTPNAQTGN
jgi:hypothetical protein